MKKQSKSAAVSFESFTFKLPANVAHRLKFLAGEKGVTPEAYIAIGAVSLTFGDREDPLDGRGQDYWGAVAVKENEAKPAGAAAELSPGRVVVELTGKQFTRLDGVAKLLGSSVPQLLVAQTLGNLDACCDDWAEWQDIFHREIDFYAEGGNDSEIPEGERLEDSAPQRMRKQAGLLVA